MSAIFLIALMNPYYLRNLIEFLGQPILHRHQGNLYGEHGAEPSDSAWLVGTYFRSHSAVRH